MSEANYLQELNDAQRAPVVHKDGPLMVIAGAGSGKTRVLTYRIAHLMSQDIDAFNILALTFTNKAAREMKERIAKIVGESEAKNIWMGTFHSVFARILRSEADKLVYPRDFTIYDSADSLQVIKQVIKDLKLDTDIYKPKQVQSRISKFKNNLITVKAYFQNPELMEADNYAKRPAMGDVYRRYVDKCFKAGAMDFDDLLLRTNELLARFPEVLAKYQKRFQYILVDEYQDTNHSQYLIVKALSNRHHNLCVVGDDAQSIYSFRGANIQNIFNFRRDYPEAEVYKLEQNYRSTKTIVGAANSLIEKNKERLPKVVWTANDEGEKIRVMRTYTDTDEGRFVASDIFEHQMRLQLQPQDFAILYRTNSQSRAMEDALRKKGIPFRIYGGLSFYQRKEIKDVLAYLRLVVNPKDDEAFRRVVNFPARGIGNTTMDKLFIAADQYKVSLFDIVDNINKIDLNVNNGTKRKLADFALKIKSFQALAKEKDAFELTDHIIKNTGLLQEYRKDVTPEGLSRVENIQELMNAIQDFIDSQKEEPDADISLTSYLQDVALYTDLDKDDDNPNKVTLMTVHMAKGLEFPYIYIVGMEEDLFPSGMSVNTRAELEEERRLFYVALTRAEKKATITFAESRYRWGKLNYTEPSRFISEIDDKFLEFNYKPGDLSGNPFLDADIFDDHTTSHKKSPSKPKNKKVVKKEPKKNPNPMPKNLKKITDLGAGSGDSNIQIKIGDIVEHARFGKGTVIQLEGQGSNKKATIKFDKDGDKKLLLKFAKLKILNS
jgi:DNA helicase-2/ATP-dependent DNA helicase PcrA